MKRDEARKLIKQHQLDLCDKITRREDKKNLEEIGFDPEECKACHLPGDCPLCGGK